MSESISTHVAAAGHANYPGDVSGCVGQLVGPNLFGEVLVAVTADYDQTTGRTRVGFDYARKWVGR